MQWRNLTLARTFERLLDEAEATAEAASRHGAGSEERRQTEIAAMRKVWSTGFVAEAIVEHCKHEFWNERQKMMQGGLLSMEDMARYKTKVEPALTYDYCGWTVGKCGPWSQGPVFLQQLALLKGIDGFAELAPDSVQHIHTVIGEWRLLSPTCTDEDGPVYIEKASPFRGKQAGVR